MLEQLGEDRHGLVLYDGVSLDVVASDDVPKGPEAGGHHRQLPAVQQSDQVGDDLSVHNTLG